MSQKFIDILMTVITRTFVDLSGSYRNIDVKFNPQEIATSGVVIVNTPSTATSAPSLSSSPSNSMTREGQGAPPPPPHHHHHHPTIPSATTQSGFLALPPDDTNILGGANLFRIFF